MRRITEHRELAILDALEQTPRVSQRVLADRVGMSVGFLNRCLRQLLANGHVRVADRGVRPFAYRVTAAGRQHHDRLMYEHYRSILASVVDLERRVRERLCELQRKGAQRVAFYGAGEVMAKAQKCAELIGLEVVVVVDDDPQKHGELADGLRIHDPSAIAVLRPDAVVITTLSHAHQIRQRFRGSGRGTPVLWHL